MTRLANGFGGRAQGWFQLMAAPEQRNIDWGSTEIEGATLAVVAQTVIEALTKG
jgi:hypothetical protein